MGFQHGGRLNQTFSTILTAIQCAKQSSCMPIAHFPVDLFFVFCFLLSQFCLVSECACFSRFLNWKREHLLFLINNKRGKHWKRICVWQQQNKCDTTISAFIGAGVCVFVVSAIRAIRLLNSSRENSSKTIFSSCFYFINSPFCARGKRRPSLSRFR